MDLIMWMLGKASYHIDNNHKNIVIELLRCMQDLDLHSNNRSSELHYNMQSLM